MKSLIKLKQFHVNHPYTGWLHPKSEINLIFIGDFYWVSAIAPKSEINLIFILGHKFMKVKEKTH